MQEVAIGDATVEFPDDMSQEDITAALDKEHTRAEQLAAFIDRPDYYVGGGSGVDIKEGALMAGTSLPFPIGDMVGLAADVEMYATDPKSHNWFNYLFTAMSILPAIPAASQLNTARKAMKDMPTAKGDPENIIAYHGSDADFVKFSDDFMSAGTGAQINGWGHYFGVERKAKRYRDQVTERKLLKSIDMAEMQSLDFKQLAEKVKNSEEYTPEFKNLVEQFDKAGLLGERTLYDAVEKVNRLMKTPDTPAGREAASLADTIPIGKMYKVEILGNKEQFLNWRTKLAKQSKYVQDGIKKVVEGVAKDTDQVNFLLAKYKNMKGREVYEDLATLLKGNKNTSKTLYANGIKGNTLETLSGSTDFIVFGPAIIDITKKYSLPAAAITTALLAAGASTQKDEDETLYE